MSDTTGHGGGIGDAPIEDEYRELMNDVARVLDLAFNGEAKGADRQTGFVLLVFPFHSHEGRCNYMSNGAARADIVTLFREQIKRLEGAPDQEGHA